MTQANRLSVSSVHPRKAIGRCGFTTAAPGEWNRLPPSVRSQQITLSFRSQLKTYLVRLAHPPMSGTNGVRTVPFRTPAHLKIFINFDVTNVSVITTIIIYRNVCDKFKLVKHSANEAFYSILY